MEGRKRGAQPGNRNAAKSREVRKALVEVLNEDPSLLKQMVRAQVEKACDGDTQAFKEIRDTIDGKPAQNVTIDGDGEGGPVNFQHAVVEFVQSQHGQG